ncbi:MAG TPA: lipopolysaccharide assembly protein LapA domain-containing protein [Ramlibacter sp.]|nr:lipopolysaccharide assembly protein LapA domain-containing protein [Ramlibacter sp.]
MRARVLLLILAIALVGAFAALNWPEFTRTSQMNFGILTMELPLGLVLLSLLGLGLLAYLLGSASMQTRHLLEFRQHTKELQAQRELADKAEASRFTALRQHLDTHLRDGRPQGTVTTTEFERAFVQGQRELRQQLEQMDRVLIARLADIENRLDARLGRPEARVEPLPDARAEPVRDTTVRSTGL